MVFCAFVYFLGTRDYATQPSFILCTLFKCDKVQCSNCFNSALCNHLFFKKECKSHLSSFQANKEFCKFS